MSRLLGSPVLGSCLPVHHSSPSPRPTPGQTWAEVSGPQQGRGSPRPLCPGHCPPPGLPPSRGSGCPPRPPSSCPKSQHHHRGRDAQCCRLSAAQRPPNGRRGLRLREPAISARQRATLPPLAECQDYLWGLPHLPGRRGLWQVASGLKRGWGLTDGCLERPQSPESESCPLRAAAEGSGLRQVLTQMRSAYPGISRAGERGEKTIWGEVAPVRAWVLQGNESGYRQWWRHCNCGRWL